MNVTATSIPLKLFLFGTVLLAGISGCSVTGQTAEQPETQGENRDLESLFWSRVEESRMDFTRADVDFMTDMIVHHAQALIMSRLAPENGAGSSVQTLAARIINAQKDEIATMQKWLRDRGQPVPEIHIDGLNLMVHMGEPEENTRESDMNEDGEKQPSHHRSHEPANHQGMDHHHDMPGMLTQEQLEELASKRGAEFDRTFLEFMIEHHQGAVIMVKNLFAADGAANDTEIFDLASDIHAEQLTEINRMQQMLKNLSPG